ncbi:CRISPR-associated endonuclease Cas9 [archaeon BMS3Bbin15]|nr:CRISPR-associated endonuclease Cas9 [archaeon BMS3Bbin15]
MPRKVLANNSSDEDQLSGKSGQDLRVPVLNMRGKPLMPTTPRNARVLLKQEKARVVQRSPFTIQLNYPTGEAKQDITLGIDAGYSAIGFSAVTDKKKLICGELTLRKRISKLLEQRRTYRRTRRAKLWHRKPRFNNRSRPNGWLAPSIQHKFDTHLRLIEKLKKILPVTKITVEVSSFDTQKMQNPEIKGVEYQHGELQGYEVREYLLEKWGHKCAYCGKSNVPLEIEHIIPKIRGGTDRVFNLTIACHKCNQKKGDRTAEEFGYPEIQKKAKQTLKSTAFMNIVRWRLANTLNCAWTYGYITKHNRIKLGLEKSHVNDAFVITGGTTQERAVPYMVTQTRRNNRSIQTNRKGFKPSIRKQRYKLQPNDLVKYRKILCRVKGVFNYGKWVRLSTQKGKIINTNIKKVELVKYGGGLQFQF